MTYENYRMIFMVGAILAGVLLLASVVLFFVLKIPAVIGDLTGYTARKAIEQIRAENETGATAKKLTSGNRVRGRLTDKMTPSGRVTPITGDVGLAPATEKFSTKELGTEALTSYQTSLLEETTAGSGETAVLNAGAASEDTTILEYGKGSAVFQVEFEVTYIHTEETID